MPNIPNVTYQNLNAISLLVLDKKIRKGCLPYFGVWPFLSIFMNFANISLEKYVRVQRSGIDIIKYHT